MTEDEEIKVIIDTNLWISFLIGKQLAGLKNLIIEGSITLVMSEQILEEITLVTQRPKLKKYFNPEKVEELLKFLKAISLYVEIQSEVIICRDVKDNYLLALAQDSQAHFLVTGDEDLLSLKQINKTKIITYQEFLAKITVN